MPTFLVPPAHASPRSRFARVRDRIARFLSRGHAVEPDPDDADLGRFARARAWLGEALHHHRSALVKVTFTIGAGVILLVAMGGTWGIAPATAVAAGPITSPTTPPPIAAPDARPSDPAPPPPPATAPPPPAAGRVGKAQQLAGKLNLNTAGAEQLVLLPTVGPSKAERILTWRKKNGGFRRVADLRRVKGFGYKTFKKLEPYLAIDGETTLARR